MVVEGTEARFRVREQLAGVSLPSDAVGTTRAVEGGALLRPGSILDAERSRITVDLRTLKSDEGRRDNFLQRSVLETSQHPTAVFVAREVKDLPWPLPASGKVSFQIIGDTTIHGVTRPLTWAVEATVQGDEVAGRATTRFKFADFGLPIPRVPMVLSIEDDIRLEIDFQARKAQA
ncbi:MAG: YceI family protein [Chloroflexi bacterium]|nr:YceI family protein [Chloroflexota bacterium]